MDNLFETSLNIISIIIILAGIVLICLARIDYPKRVKNIPLLQYINAPLKSYIGEEKSLYVLGTILFLIGLFLLE